MPTSNASGALEHIICGSASFRDPGGIFRLVRNTPLRFVRGEFAEELRRFLASGVGRSWQDSGRMVGSEELDGGRLASFAGEPAFDESHRAEMWGGVWQHERIPFPSTVEEWTPGMLHAAGRLTLDLALDLLEYGYGLKDATPANVLFRGSSPVFVDVLSIEPRDPGDPLWLPYAQFVRMFLLPLLVNKVTALPLRAAFSIGREGVEPEIAKRLLPFGVRSHGAGLWLVTAPMLFSGRGGKAAVQARTRQVPPEQAKFVLRRLFRGLKKTLDEVVDVTPLVSSWTDYVEAYHSPTYFDAKRAWVATAVDLCRPSAVLDIGCNTGELSLIAAAKGARVVSIDNDPEVVQRLFDRMAKEKMDILPLVVDLAAPTPGRGWLNVESPSFLDRTRGQFDCVLAMAVIHHLIATNGIPLPAIIDLFAELTRDAVALEFVPPGDPLFRQLARGRDHLYEWLTRERFEDACRRHFQIVRAEALPSGDRVGYVLRKRRQ